MDGALVVDLCEKGDQMILEETKKDQGSSRGQAVKVLHFCCMCRMAEFHNVKLDNQNIRSRGHGH